MKRGRKEEFGRHPDFQHPEKQKRVPDPIALETFKASKLDWSELTREPHYEWLSFYRRLLAVRHTDIVPLLHTIRGAFRPL